jgi:hypothetical protein
VIYHDAHLELVKQEDLVLLDLVLRELVAMVACLGCRREWNCKKVQDDHQAGRHTVKH